MGYSYCVSAGNVLDFILDQVTDPNGSSNGWTHAGKSYFYERGREQADGSVTGTVYRTGIYTPTDGREPYEAAFKAGSVKIEADGKLVRFPNIPKSVRANAKLAYADGSIHDYHTRRYAPGGRY